MPFKPFTLLSASHHFIVPSLEYEEAKAEAGADTGAEAGAPTGLHYKCQGSPSRVKKGRQSFPSGHTAVIFYSMTFTFLYLQVSVIY